MTAPFLPRVRPRFLHEYQFPLLPIYLHRQIVRLQSSPERGEFFRWQFVHEAEGGRGQVGAVFLERQRAPVEFLRRAAGGVGAGEDVQHDVARVGEEFDEDSRQLSGKRARCGFTLRLISDCRLPLSDEFTALGGAGPRSGQAPIPERVVAPDRPTRGAVLPRSARAVPDGDARLTRPEVVHSSG